MLPHVRPLLCCLIWLAACRPVPADAAESAAPAVNLNCKIVSDREGPRHAVWLVELRDAAGRPLRQALRFVGDTVHFRDLSPGIYRIYLWGRGGCRSTTSVDLTPASNKPPGDFSKVLHVPETASHDGLGVNVLALSVSKEAHGEMRAAEKAVLANDESGSLRHLQRALILDPDYAEAWNNLGAYYYRNGEYEMARIDFCKATELQPDFYIGWVNLSASLLADRRYDEAVDAGRKALALNAGDALVNSRLGLAYFYLRNYAKAKRYFRRARDLDPVMAEAPQLLLAQICIREGDPAQAASYMREFLGYHPNSPQAGSIARTLTVLEGDAARTPDPLYR